jgi:hypothetical protein
MSLNVISTLRGLPAHEAARLIGCAPTYVKNDNFVNLLNSFDINKKSNPKEAKQQQQQDAMLANQFNMFAGVPGLKDQVQTWLSSV